MEPRNRTSGGVFIALGVGGGLVAGVALGEPSAGVLAGSAAGVAAALLLWLAQRGRS